jgi:hypothetical protein
VRLRNPDPLRRSLVAPPTPDGVRIRRGSNRHWVKLQWQVTSHKLCREIKRGPQKGRSREVCRSWRRRLRLVGRSSRRRHRLRPATANSAAVV